MTSSEARATIACHSPGATLHRKRRPPRRKRPRTPRARPSIRSPATGRVGHRLSRKLVPLFIVQFVINCLLALVANQSAHSAHSLSQASPVGPAERLAVQDVDKHNRMGQLAGEQLRQLQGRRLETGNERDFSGQNRRGTSPVQTVHETFVEPEGAGQGAGRGRHSASGSDLLATVMRRRPRWRLNPTALSSGAQSPETPSRRNRFLTIEEATDTDKEGTADELDGDLFRSKLEQGDQERGSTTPTSERAARNRRHQQQGPTTTAANGPSDRQLLQMKTRLEIQRAEQAYRNKLTELKQRYLTNRAITDRAYYILLIIYAILITFGTISNSLICLTVSIGRRRARFARIVLVRTRTILRARALVDCLVLLLAN